MEQTNENSEWVWLVWESESHSCSKGCKGLKSNANSVLLVFLAHVLVARVTAWWIHVHCIVFQVRTVQWKNRVILWCWCSSCDTMPYGQQCCVWECMCPSAPEQLACCLVQVIGLVEHTPCPSQPYCTHALQPGWNNSSWKHSCGQQMLRKH